MTYFESLRVGDEVVVPFNNTKKIRVERVSAVHPPIFAVGGRKFSTLTGLRYKNNHFESKAYAQQVTQDLRDKSDRQEAAFRIKRLRVEELEELPLSVLRQLCATLNKKAVLDAFENFKKQKEQK